MIRGTSTGRVADVVVVGGGPAGATTALEVARRGFDVVLLDRSAFPRDKLCGDFIHPLGVETLARLGLLPQIESDAQRLAGMRIVSPEGREVFARFPDGVGLSVSRSVLDAAIVRAAAGAGVDVRAPLAARQISRNGRWQVATDAGPIEARLLVGADGIWSRVSAAVGLRRARPTQGRFAVGTYVRDLPGAPGFAEMHLGIHSYCGISALPDDRCNVTTVLPRAWLRPAGPQRRSEPLRLGAFLTRFPRLRDRMGTATVTGPLRATGPLAPHDGPVVDDGVLLVGDAAAFTDPLTGLGVSLALTGAVVAAETIAHAFARSDLSRAGLAGYARWHRDRLRALHAILRLATWFPRTRLIEPLVRAWQRDPALAARFLGVLAHGGPADAVLSPRYVAQVMQACISSR